MIGGHSHRVLLAGASGLVGGLLLQRLLQQDGIAQVVAPTRRPLAAGGNKLLAVTGALDDPAAMTELENTIARVAPMVDSFVCCLGTTLRKAGSKPAFLAVDRDLVVRLAALAHRLGARQAVLVSSAGASAQSGNFYLRVKGETERLLAGMGFERLDILRPGLLLGERQEHRLAEAWGQRLLPWLNPLLRGGLARYRSIAASEVADAIVALLGEPETGQFLHENRELLRLTARSTRCEGSGPAPNR